MSDPTKQDEARQRADFAAAAKRVLADIEAGEMAMSLPKISRLPALARDGHRTSKATVYRWAASGHRGVVLDTARMPAGLVSTAAAVHRFLAGLNEQSQ